MNAKQLEVKLQEVYKLVGMSRQYYHKAILKQHRDEVMWERILEMVIEFRGEYPRSSARKIHHCLRIKEVGINRFEAFVSAQGLSVKRWRSFIKTTRPGLTQHPNLVNGLEIDGINHLWVSDLTYFITSIVTLYIVLILDVYSRRIIGYSASNNMMVVNNQKALLMAFNLRKKCRYENLIHHSDKGSQYDAFVYKKMLTDAGIEISMAKICLENPYAERINGIIKNDYLVAYNINTLADLKKALPKAVRSYNNYPHGNLRKQSPIEFEESLRQTQGQKGEIMKLYDFEK